MEDLAYRRLIDEYYLAERPFNGCSTDVQRLIGMTDFPAEVEYVLNRFFEKTDDGYVHHRIEKDIFDFKQRIEKQIKAGKASAESRRNKGSGNTRSTDVQHPFNERSTDAEQVFNQPITNNHISSSLRSEDSKSRKKSKISSDFLPTQESVSWCLTKHPKLNVSAETEKFVNYFLAKGTTYLDWQKAWMNWMDRAAEGQQSRPAGRTTQHDARMEVAKQIFGGTGNGSQDGGIIDLNPSPTVAGHRQAVLIDGDAVRETVARPVGRHGHPDGQARLGNGLDAVQHGGHGRGHENLADSVSPIPTSIFGDVFGSEEDQAGSGQGGHAEAGAKVDEGGHGSEPPAYAGGGEPEFDDTL